MVAAPEGNPSSIGDRKGTTKKLCDKDFAERSGELSGESLPQNPCFFFSG